MDENLSSRHRSQWSVPGNFTLYRADELTTLPCPANSKEYSVHALNWAISNITESHDELVILRVIDPSSSSSTKLAMNESAMEDAREEAEHVLEDAMRKVRASAAQDPEENDERQPEKQVSR